MGRNPLLAGMYEKHGVPYPTKGARLKKEVGRTVRRAKVAARSSLSNARRNARKMQRGRGKYEMPF